MFMKLGIKDPRLVYYIFECDTLTIFQNKLSFKIISYVLIQANNTVQIDISALLGANN